VRPRSQRAILPTLHAVPVALHAYFKNKSFQSFSHRCAWSIDLTGSIMK
jgi:hypothetical protein